MWGGIVCCVRGRCGERNYILKKGYNGHSARGGRAGKSAVEREAMVVQQV